MSEYLQAEIEQATSKSTAARERMSREVAACELAVGAWIAKWGADLGKRRVTHDKPELAQQLGTEAVRSVRHAIDRLQESAVSAFRDHMHETAWPHQTLTDDDFKSKRYEWGTMQPFGGKLPRAWEEAVRAVVGESVGKALVEAGFDKAGTGDRDRSVDWRVERGKLLYPYAVPATSPEVLDAIKNYEGAYDSFVNAETTRRELVARSHRMAADDVWGAAGGDG